MKIRKIGFLELLELHVPEGTGKFINKVLRVEVPGTKFSSRTAVLSTAVGMPPVASPIIIKESKKRLKKIYEMVL